jgi:hypothetical protein
VSRNQDKKATAVDRLARLELLWSKLQQDYEAATYHQNPIVADCINAASDELYEATQHLFSERFDEAMSLEEVAWLRINFARQVLDADAVEHFLGESDYLELCEVIVPPETLIRNFFADLELKIRVFRDRLTG